MPSKELSLGDSRHPRRHPPCWEPISSARDSAGCLNTLCARLHTPQTFPRCFRRRGPKYRPSPRPEARAGLGPALCRGPSSRSIAASAIPCAYEAVLRFLHRAPRAAGRPLLPSQPCGQRVQGCSWLGAAGSPHYRGLCGALGAGSCAAGETEVLQEVGQTLLVHVRVLVGSAARLCVGCLP